MVGAPSGLIGALCLDTFLHITYLVYDMLYIYIYIDNHPSVYTKIYMYKIGIFVCISNGTKGSFLFVPSIRVLL